MKKEIPFPEIPLRSLNREEKKAMKLMEEDGLDGLLLFNNQNLTYYLGFGRRVFNGSTQGSSTREGVVALSFPKYA